MVFIATSFSSDTRRCFSIWPKAVKRRPRTRLRQGYGGQARDPPSRRTSVRRYGGQAREPAFAPASCGATARQAREPRTREPSEI